MGGYYPAVQIRPPESPLDMFTRVLQLQHLQQAGQAQTIQNQMLQEEQQDDAKWRSVFSSAAQHPEWSADDYLKAGEAQGVGPRSYFTVAQGLQQHQQGLATLGQEQLKVMDGILSKTQGYMQDVLDASPEDKLTTQQEAKAKSINLIQNTPGLNPAIRQQFLKEVATIPDDVYRGDDYFTLLMGRHNLYATQSERAMKQAQTAEATGKGAEAQAQAGLAQARMPGAQAESTIQQQQAALSPQQRALAGNLPYAAATGVPGAQRALQLETEQKRQAAIAQVQAQAQQYAANSALAKVPPHLVPAATADATKVAQEYADATSAADDMRTFISEARQGNKIAYAYSPTEGVLTLNTARGVKRVNMPEIQSYGAAGSAFDRVMGWLGKQTKGASIPADVLDDMETLHGAIAANAQTKYTNKLRGINQNYGSNFQPVEMQTAAPGAAGNRPPLSSFEK